MLYVPKVSQNYKMTITLYKKISFNDSEWKGSAPSYEFEINEELFQQKSNCYKIWTNKIEQIRIKKQILAVDLWNNYIISI